MQWYAKRGGKTVGPVSEDELRHWVSQGNTEGTFVSNDADGRWMPLEVSPFAAGGSPSRPTKQLSADVRAAYLAHVQPSTSAPPAPAPAQAVTAPSRYAPWILWGAAAVVVFIVWRAISSRPEDETDEKKTTLPSVEEQIAAAPEPPKEVTLGERLSKAETLDDALEVVSAHFSDSQETTDPGGALFAAWAAKRLTWAELSKLPKTKRPLVMKDPEAERGKLLCASGSIVQIAIDRTLSPPVSTGIMLNEGLNPIRFVAAGSSGELVENSVARFCGVTIGTYTYSNTGGGTGHAVFAVGMFDIAANKASPSAGVP